MRNFIFFLFFGLVILLNSCNQFNQKHPQAGIGEQSPPLNEESILRYVDSVNNNLPHFTKTESLIYTLDQLSFFVTKYSAGELPVLYINTGTRGDTVTYVKKYYLKNKHLVFYEEQQNNSSRPDPFVVSRAYMRNNVIFYSEEKQAATEEELKTIQFKRSEITTHNYADEITRLENALQQQGDFNLVFDDITAYPKARYIILSRNVVNAYRAPVLVEKEDDFIKELSSNKEKYKGRKLQLKWTIRNNEAIYQSGTLE
ncbi:hypothetical protein [Rubrolithibacter danxiaensis]|uniref:hypothetical protein n=1 Tax=Rubrolithibacter danxiaensis TaxID=3390805 RepID=UPI003BF903EE